VLQLNLHIDSACLSATCVTAMSRGTVRQKARNGVVEAAGPDAAALHVIPPFSPLLWSDRMRAQGAS
jgi:hypothetical protein